MNIDIADDLFKLSFSLQLRQKEIECVNLSYQILWQISPRKTDIGGMAVSRNPSCNIPLKTKSEPGRQIA